MAFTVTTIVDNTVGNRRMVTADLTFDASYATGGEAITAAEFGLRELENLQIPGTDGTLLFAWDRANGKIVVFDDIASEESATTDLSHVTIRCTAYGY